MRKVPTNSIILCEHVHVAYGREKVLHDVCLSIQRGMFLPLLGPNGAGKSTLLRVILGLIRPWQGRIDTPFDHSPAGYVPQQQSIDPVYPVSVRDIVGMGLYPELGWWRPRRRRDRDRVQHILEQFELEAHARKTFAELSGGMKQKTLLARAFATRAEVLLLDEPTSELDEQSERNVMIHLYRLCEEEGKTILLAHHGKLHGKMKVFCRVEHGRVRLMKTEEASV